ncbi:sialidase family protein [Streptomyces sp. SCSIO ZS0520]|uniref:sialidase family protein n=1 Tax=Streptomyces sp. SCSIO ZS0520 TaxID=2892996 RepID=UPI0021DAB68A|nr:sialidase family protein [Streptomyces sp. SCSIO ZS0520]
MRPLLPARARPGTVLLVLAALLAGSLAGAPPAGAAEGPSGPGDPVVHTFEEAPVGAAPPGCAPTEGASAAVVSDVRGQDSARSLRVRDTSATGRTDLACPGPTRLGARLGFAMRPEALPNGFLFSVLGRFESGGAARPVFHFQAAPDGSLRWQDGTGWQALAPAGSVAPGRWDRITVEVPRDRGAAYLYVGDAYAGRAAPAGGKVAALTGHQFSGAGTAPTGDDVFVDDVSFGPASQDTTATRDFDAEMPGQPPSGCTAPANAAPAVVSDVRGEASPRALRILDTSAAQGVETTCPAPAAPSGTLAFSVRPEALPNGFTFGLLGHRAGGGAPSPGFHFLAGPGGTLSWYDGSAWRQLAPAGTLPTGRWTGVEVAVAADRSGAEVRVGGTSVGRAGPVAGAALQDLSGYRFGSAGSAPTGDEVSVDRVAFGPATAARGHESDPVGSVPPGCAAPAGATAATVSDARGKDSARSLRVRDASATGRTELDCLHAPRRATELAFWAYPESLPNGFTFSLLGHTAGVSGAPAPVFHLSVTPQGALRWYDGLGWTQLAAPGTVPTGQWSELAVRVPEDTARAQLLVGGRVVGEAGSWGMREADDLTGYRFGGSGTAPTGDDVFLDGIRFGPPSAQVPAPAGPFAVGPTVTVDQVEQGNLQMPNSAARLPGGETLAVYPRHGDAVDAVGTELVATPDDGRSWRKQPARNPFPDEQSSYVTQLAGGDLLAVNYLTFMVPGSNNTRATVRTARSSDGGATWRRGNGTMTAPGPMKPIPSGKGLGGFVLINRVLENPDGSLYQSAYGYYAGDAKYRQVLLVSTDGGVDWSVRSTVAVDPGLSGEASYEGFDEGSVVRLADGSLLTLMRTGNYRPLYQARSTDDGRTWSAPQVLRAGPDGGQPVTGIRPELTLMGDGRLVLLIGRPGMSMLLSEDGSGTSWSAPQAVDYRNSGNGTSVAIGPDRLLLIGDRGADWTPGADSHRRIWSRLVTVR